MKNVWMWLRPKKQSNSADQKSAPGTEGQNPSVNQFLTHSAPDQRLEFALEATMDGLWDWNINSGDVYFSPRYVAMLGYDVQEMPGRVEMWIKLVHPEDLPKTEAALKKHFLDGTPYQPEFRMKTKGGDWKWVLARGKVVERNPDGSPRRMVGLHTDIDFTKQYEDILKESLESTKQLHRQLINILDNLPTGAVIVNPTYLRANRAIEELTGYRRQEIDSREKWLELLHPKNSEEARAVIFDRQGELPAGQPAQLELQARDGSRKIVEFATFKDDSAEVWLLHDVTEKLSARERSLVSARLASLGEMAAGLAHEINNPLAIIKGKNQLITKIAERIQGDGDVQKISAYARSVDATVDRIAKIIRGLRAFARDGTHDPKTPHTMRAMLDETLSFCATRLANAGIELTIQDNSQRPLMCRPTQISQVVLNLLSNAHDAVVGLETRSIHIQVDDTGDGVRVTVQDTGPGVPVEIQDRIMQPFFTTKETSKGTGLGLSISRGIVEDHGGKFYLERSTTGARFVFWLPYGDVPSIQAA